MEQQSGAATGNLGKTSGNAYEAVLEYCKPFKDRYDRCFDSWYRQGFLHGRLHHTCDDQFEDYKACILEEAAARNLRLPGVAEISPTLRKQ
mmetsp:Transcript_125368/g.250236  ORF Transcript_125368/g.250236 Transcript_125368/m.250236 type:complete len:91 (+) Transcript_125368:72-344(+)|eukprot:CAMPEP_0172664294 /NCGR_PEP_ID=MMETSP1074-20121228/6497_1 /TAXON_ID=2916 /ORGANISM="Ceratium fusus, Strain PA161109" /LENGTH=90 /DNA_ID=CAMNT_0013480417 /DNA_START=1 /DNA_END=273 /DNA_ORIENTATION=+